MNLEHPVSPRVKAIADAAAPDERKLLWRLVYNVWFMVHYLRHPPSEATRDELIREADAWLAGELKPIFEEWHRYAWGAYPHDPVCPHCLPVTDES